DDALAPVPEHARERHRQVARDRVQVAVTDAARAEANEDFAVAWIADGERLDGERLVRGVQDRGLGCRHGVPPRGLLTVPRRRLARGSVEWTQTGAPCPAAVQECTRVPGNGHARGPVRKLPRSRSHGDYS